MMIFIVTMWFFRQLQQSADGDERKLRAAELKGQMITHAIPVIM